MPVNLLEPTIGELMKMPIGMWITCLVTGGNDYQSVRGKHCLVILAPEPPCSSRSQFKANLLLTDPFYLEADDLDAWGPCRYYFDEERAKAEIEAWLQARNQFEEGDLAGD